MWDNEVVSTRERNITELEEQVLRCVHHEHGGMTQTQAAKHLNVTESRISRVLKDIEKKAEVCSPIRIMLPILSNRQFEVYNCIAKHGMSLEATAVKIGTSLGSVRSTLHKMRKKGQHVPTPVKHEQYVESMDDKTSQKF